MAEEAASNNELDRSAKYYRLYLLQDPTDTDTLARYGKIQIKLAKTRHERFAALLTLDQVVRRQPENYEVRREVVEQAMHPELQQFTEAKEHLVVLCRVFANDGELQFKLGRCEEALGNFDAAETAYATAIKLAPALAEAYRDLAELQNGKLNKPANAVKALDLLVSSNPQQAKAWLYRARNLRLRGSFEPKDDDRRDLFGRAAADLAQAALVVSANEGDADVLLESIELALARGQIEQARSIVQRGLEKHGKDVRFHLAGARVETLVQRRQEAIAHLRRGLEQGPENVDVLWSLALLVIETGDWTETELIEEKLRQNRVAPAAGLSPSACAGAKGEMARSKPSSSKSAAPTGPMAGQGRSGRPLAVSLPRQAG